LIYIKKRREECVLFLDEGFSAESVATRLSTAGFTVQRFPEWFRDDSGKVRVNVEDPEIIRFCHKNGWLLVTTDHEMKNMHLEEIKKTEVAILATSHNSAENPDEWVIALINLKSRILREFKKRERPWFGTFSRTANLTISTITAAHRARPSRAGANG
jgi:predicted nuclease of predicted toxin-antitoxin system